MIVGCTYDQVHKHKILGWNSLFEVEFQYSQTQQYQEDYIMPCYT